ncbi:MAG: hypothetical protein PHP31_06840 [Lentimicrobiaceae bacterium]|nr:hypothetical protein [Lentimicrobiaceae bacterium]
MKTLILIFVIIIIIPSCQEMITWEEFTLNKTEYVGNQIKINGYYYQEWDNGTKFHGIIFLYKNGIVFQVGGSGNISELDEYARQSFYFNNDVKDKKGFWGLYLIEDKKNNL